MFLSSLVREYDNYVVTKHLLITLSYCLYVSVTREQRLGAAAGQDLQALRPGRHVKDAR